MPTQTVTELFDKIKDDHNAHKIISLLHLMLHMDAERLDGGEQGPPPVCVQADELLEQKAAVQKVSEKVDHQNVLLRQQEQWNKDVNAQLQELHSKFRLISEMNKRLFVKSKRLEGEYEELCLQNSAAKVEMEEQRSLILELQQRLGGLEAAQKEKEELRASEKVKEKRAFKKEVGEVCLQVKTVKEEVKEQRSLVLDLQQRLNRLEARRKQREAALAVAQEAQKKKGKEEEERGKQSKTAKQAEAEAKPRTRGASCKEKVAACGRTGAKPRTAEATRGQSDKPGTEKRAAADRRKPRISLDPRSNPKEAKGAKAPAHPERKDSRLPPIHRDRTAPFHRARLKDTLLPGRFGSGRSGTLVPQSSQETSLRTPGQVLQDSAKTRIPKLPPLGSRPLFPHHSSHRFTGAKTPAEVLSLAQDSVEDRSPLFPAANVDFQRDEDFSPWEHERLVHSNEDGEDNQ